MPNGCGDKLICRVGALAVLLCAAAAPAGPVSLWREAVVTGDEVRVADVCRLRDADPQLAADCADVVVAAAPVPGGSVIVSMNDVRCALQAAGVNMATVVLKGAATCDVLRPLSVPEEQAASRRTASTKDKKDSGHEAKTLREAVEDFLAAELTLRGARIQVGFGRVPPAALQLSEPEFAFTVRRTSGGRLGLVGLEVVVLADGVQVQLIPLLVNVSVVRPAVVASRSVNLGATLAAADVRVVEMTFTRLDQVGETDPAVVIGQRAKRFLPAGEVIMRRHLEPVPLVKRGQIVDVHSRVRGVSIVTAAKALTSGAYGDVVELRTAARSKEKFAATVSGPGRVRVQDQGRALAMGGER